MPAPPRALLLLAAAAASRAQPPTWGYNYDRTSTGAGSAGRDVVLGGLYAALGPAAALAHVAADFAAMRALNGSSVRLMVDLPAVVRAPPPPAGAPDVDAAFLGWLVGVCDAARGAALTVDLTGSTFVDRDAVAPAWHAADDAALLRARSAFWGALAGALRGHAAVRNFNLINEPYMPWADEPAVVTGCIPLQRPNASTATTFCYLHPVLRRAAAAWTAAIEARFPTPALLAAHWPDFPRSGESWAQLAIPREGDAGDARHGEYAAFAARATGDFCAALAGAIRTADAARLVTIGIQMGAYPDRVTGAACAASVDFFSVHIYPEARLGTPAALEEYFVTTLDLLPPGVAKTVTWEEVYPLALNNSMGFAELPAAMLRAAARARAPLTVNSFYSFYWGTAASLDLPPMGAAIYNEWLAAWAAAAPPAASRAATGKRASARP